MGVDCSLLFGYTNGVREVHLDRSYCFSRIDINKWLKREELLEQLRKVLDFKDSNNYSSYWLGYTTACLENLNLFVVDIVVAIVEDNTGFYELVCDAKTKAGLEFETKEFIPFSDVINYLN